MEMKKKKIPKEQFSVFLGEVKKEFWKISWSDRQELIRYTKIIVGALFIMGGIVYCFDLLIRFALTSLEKFFF